MIAAEMFKVYRSLPIFSEFFHRGDINYNLRTNSQFAVPNIGFVFHESIFYLGPKTKELTSVDVFKKYLKEGKLKNCP